jgi:Tfp pilus assembly PilM family ATPase
MAITTRKQKDKPTYVGLSIQQDKIELVVLSPKTATIEKAFSVPIPDNLFHPEYDMIQNPETLKKLLTDLFTRAKVKPSRVHLSLPATLLRMVDMPRMEPSSLHLSLASEAERYKAFDNTEALVDFVVLDDPAPASNTSLMSLILGAIRQDSLSIYLKCLKDLKIKPVSVGLEPLSILRGMAGTGILENLTQQIGTESNWGVIFVENGRVRFMLWRQNRILELRELTMDTEEFFKPTPSTVVVEDLLEEIKRTSKKNNPAVWLTDNMPSTMQNYLAQTLECPISPIPQGSMLSNLQNPVRLSSLGTALTSIAPFALELDFLNLSETVNGSNLPEHALPGTEEPNNLQWLIPAGIGSLALGGLVSFGLFIIATMAAQQLPPLKANVDTIKLEVAALQGRETELKQKVQLNQLLRDQIQRSKAKNHVLVSLTEDLKQNTPKSLWLQSVTVGNTLEMLGKALNHKPVMYFAKGFDTSQYFKNIQIDAITESQLGSNLVYDFKISGLLNLDLKPEDSGASNSSNPENTTENPASGSTLPKQSGA